MASVTSLTHASAAPERGRRASLLTAWVVTWWTAFGVMSAVQYRQMSAASGRPSELATALIPAMASAWLWIPATWLALVLAQRAPIGAAHWARAAILHAAATLAVVLYRAIAVVVLNPWIGWYKTLPSYMEILITSVQNNVFFYWMVLAAAHAVHYARNARLRESQLAEARLRALTTQLQPHFLFNALNTVASLVHENPAAAERVVMRLSALMRQTTDTTGELVTLREELDLLENYLEIEQARFEDRLEIRWSVEADATSALVPHLILQPIVENAIVHGFRPVARPVVIDIRIARENAALGIIVADTGAGYDAALARDGVGLRNTRERLDAVFGGITRSTSTVSRVSARASDCVSPSAKRPRRPRLRHDPRVQSGLPTHERHEAARPDRRGRTARSAAHARAAGASFRRRRRRRGESRR